MTASSRWVFALPWSIIVASMARADGLDTANSQFFIVLSPTMQLDHKYTGFGRVIEGMTAVDGIAPGEPPAAPTTIVRSSLGDGAAAQ